jgi:hypothetical protein
MRCKCDENTVPGQIVLDKILYDVDRAIDLYAVGNVDFGIPESRAAAYGYIAKAATKSSQKALLQSLPDPIIDDILKLIESLLIPSDPLWWDKVLEGLSDEQKKLIKEELCIQRGMESQWENLVKTMAPSCIGFGDIFGENGVVTKVIDDAIKDVVSSSGDSKCPPVDVSLPEHYELSLQKIAAAEILYPPSEESYRRPTPPAAGGPPSPPTLLSPPDTGVPEGRHPQPPKSAGTSKEEKQEKPK